MAVNSLLHLINALAREEFDLILGTAESSWVDFKSAPYGLDTDRSRWELAKDVSAMANSGAGAIIIGFETEANEADRIETASARRPTRLDAVKIQTIRDLVRSWIFPRIREFDVQFYSEPGTAEEGYAMLHIPAQRAEDRPFVVTRMADGEAKGSVVSRKEMLQTPFGGRLNGFIINCRAEGLFELSLSVMTRHSALRKSQRIV
jgi:hypothetical protein